MENAIFINNEDFVNVKSYLFNSVLAPPSPPQNVQVTEVTSRSVTLVWSPPASNGGSELTGTKISSSNEL